MPPDWRNLIAYCDSLFSGPPCSYESEANNARQNPIWQPNIVVFDNTSMILAVTRDYHSISFLMTRKTKTIGSTRFEEILVLNLRYVKELFLAFIPKSDLRLFG